MKKQILACVSTLALSANAFALDVAEFVSQPHQQLAGYDYAEASLLFHPDDFKGFELRGSRVVRPNVAIAGVFNRLSADAANADLTATQFGLGAHYFFAADQLQNSDLDLSLGLLNNKVEGGGLSDSDTVLVLGSQIRRMLSGPIGSSSLNFEEVYGGLQLGLASGDSSVALHGGLLVKINQQFSAKAELLLDHGSHITLGVRMKLGRPQRNPEGAGSAALLEVKPVITAALPRAPVQSRDQAQVQAQTEAKTEVRAQTQIRTEAKAEVRTQDEAQLSADPYGLTEDEMADLRSAAE